MKHGFTPFFTTLFYVCFAQASSQYDVDIPRSHAKTSDASSLLLESAFEELFGKRVPETRVSSPTHSHVKPTFSTQRALPPSVASCLSPSDMDWLNKTMADASAIQQFALQKMENPSAKPDDAFFALSPMHQQSAMAGVSFMQQLFPKTSLSPGKTDPMEAFLQDLD